MNRAETRVELSAFIGVLLVIAGILIFSYVSYGLLGGVGDGDYRNGQDTWTSEDIESSPFN